MQGADLDTVAASQQTREHLRDAYIRLGACMLFVSFPVLLMLNAFFGLGIWWVLLLVTAIGASILTGYAAFRRGQRISERARAEDRASRKAERDAQIEAFLAQKSGEGE